MLASRPIARCQVFVLTLGHSLPHTITPESDSIAVRRYALI